jgi:bacterioferritin B
MSGLLAVVRRSAHAVEQVEDYVRRETAPEGDDPTAPRIAGA